MHATALITEAFNKAYDGIDFDSGLRGGPQSGTGNCGPQSKNRRASFCTQSLSSLDNGPQCCRRNRTGSGPQQRESGWLPGETPVTAIVGGTMEAVGAWQHLATA